MMGHVWTGPVHSPLAGGLTWSGEMEEWTPMHPYFRNNHPGRAAPPQLCQLATCGRGGHVGHDPDQRARLLLQLAAAHTIQLVQLQLLSPQPRGRLWPAGETL